MAITINNVTLGSGSPPNDITVYGTASGCDNSTFVVKMEVTNRITTITTTVHPTSLLHLTSTDWNAKFDNSNGLSFGCDDDIRIIAICDVNNASKGNDTWIHSINCPSVSSCPVITVTPTIGACVNGNRSVDFAVSVIQPAGQTSIFQWDFGDGGATPTFLLTGTTTTPAHSQQHIYGSNATYNVVLHVVLPQGCPSLPTPEVALQLTVPACSTPCCPRLKIDVNSKSDCINQSPEFEFTVELDGVCPLPPNTNYNWLINGPTGRQYQLITTALTVNTNSLNWTNLASNTVGSVDIFTSGNYTIGVSFLNGTSSCAPMTNISFEVKNCCPSGQYWDENSKNCISCPTITSPQVVITGTSPGGNASTAFSTSISPAIAALYNWEVTTPNGTIFKKTTSSPNTTDSVADGMWVSNNFSGKLDINTAGSYVVNVTATGSGISQTCSVTRTIGFSIPSTPGGCPTVATPMATVTGTGSNAIVSLSTIVTPAVATSFDWEVTTPSGAIFTKTTTVPNTTNDITDGVWKNKSTGATGSLDISASGSYKVTVDAIGTKISTACPPASPGSFNIPTVPPPPSTSISPCDVILWLSIILMGIGALMVILGCLLSIPAPHVSATLFLVGWAVFGAGWLCFLFWLIFCSSVAQCSVILQIRAVVGWLILIFGTIAAIISIVAIFTPHIWPCAGLAALYGFNWGIVYWIIDWIAVKRGCLIPNPSGGK